MRRSPTRGRRPVLALVLCLPLLAASLANSHQAPALATRLTDATPPALVVDPSHGRADAAVSLTYSEDPSACSAASPADFTWDGVDVGVAAFDATCTATLSASPPADHAAPGTHQLAATDTANTGLSATADYFIDDAQLSEAPDHGPLGTSITLTYTFASTSCPGVTVSFDWDSAGGAQIATAALDGSCGAAATANPPGDAPLGAHPIVATVLDAGSNPVAGTEAASSFTVEAANGQSPPPTSTPTPGTVRGGTSTPSASPGVAPVPSAVGSDGPGPAQMAQLDLGAGLPLGRLDGLAAFALGANTGLWPFLIAIDVLVVCGIALILRRWRRGSGDGNA